MKKIMSIAVSIIIAFSCLGTAYADEERSIDQLLTAYENDNNEKDLPKVKAYFYKSYIQIAYDGKGRISTWSPADGDKFWKDTESFFRGIKSYKMTNRQITIDQNIAYVRCKEINSYKNGKTYTYKSMLTLVKVRERWYIAVIITQQV